MAPLQYALSPGFTIIAGACTPFTHVPPLWMAGKNDCMFCGKAGVGLAMSDANRIRLSFHPAGRILFSPMAEISGVHVWLVLMKAHRSLARHAEQSIARSDLGLSDFAVLEVLLHKGPQRVSDVGRRVGLTSGSITSAVNRLEDAGWVRRSAVGDDRRTRIVLLSARGEKLIRKVFAQHEAVMEAAVAGLSRAERSALVPLLKKLGTSADAAFAPDGPR